MITYNFNRPTLNGLYCSFFAKNNANKTLPILIEEALPTLLFNGKMNSDSLSIVVETELSSEDLSTITTIIDNFVPVST